MKKILQEVSLLERNLQKLESISRETEMPELAKEYKKHIYKYRQLFEVFDIREMINMYAINGYRLDTAMYAICSIIGYPDFKNGELLVDIIKKSIEYPDISIMPSNHTNAIAITNNKACVDFILPYRLFHRFNSNNIEEIFSALSSDNLDMYRYITKETVSTLSIERLSILQRTMLTNLDIVNQMPYLFIDNAYRVLYPKGLQIQSMLFNDIIISIASTYGIKEVDKIIRENCKEMDVSELASKIVETFVPGEHGEKVLDIFRIEASHNYKINQMFADLIDDEFKMVVSDNEGIRYIPKLPLNLLWEEGEENA